MVKSNLMIPFILRNVNVQLFRRYCSVLSDDGVQFETARVFNSAAVFTVLICIGTIACATAVGAVAEGKFYINEDFNGRYTLPTIFGSLLLTIIMCLYGIIKGVHEKQEILIDEVVHYIRNVYPSEVKKHEKVSGGADKNKTSVVQRMEDIKVQDEKKSNCKNDLKASSLRADDIAELLKSL